jgi:hypothetical protein
MPDRFAKDGHTCQEAAIRETGRTGTVRWDLGLRFPSHVAAADLPDVLVRLYRLLKKQGIMYVSFMLGDGERQKDGRYFNDMREEILCRLLCDAGFTVKETFITQDVRENRQDEAWVNVIAEA